MFGRKAGLVSLGAPFGGFQKGAAGGVRQRPFGGGVWHVGVERRRGWFVGGGVIGHSGLALSLGFDPHT